MISTGQTSAGAAAIPSKIIEGDRGKENECEDSATVPLNVEEAIAASWKSGRTWAPIAAKRAYRERWPEGARRVSIPTGRLRIPPIVNTQITPT